MARPMLQATVTCNGMCESHSVMCESLDQKQELKLDRTFVREKLGILRWGLEGSAA